MSKPCRICTHPEFDRLQQQLLIPGQQTSVARELGLHPSSVSRHLHKHAQPDPVNPRLRQYVKDYRYLATELPSAPPDILLAIIERAYGRTATE